MKNIIFDIDGTLWDSTDVVAESWNEAIWEKAGIKANLDGDKLKKIYLVKPWMKLVDLCCLL